MHIIRRFFSVGALCLALALLMTGTALAHGHHGGHHGGGHAYDVGTECGGGHCGGTDRQWAGGGRRCQTEIAVCDIEGCAAVGRHLHDGVLYCGYPHEDGLCNGACCALCPVEGCEAVGRHLHDGMVYCGGSHVSGFCAGDCAVWSCGA